LSTQPSSGEADVQGPPVVSFGTVNLDAWALYRDSELTMIARSAVAARLFEQRLFEPDIEGS
jgi:phosphatidylserine/phosphatidylglycerophosphate/cardiolipin synthase-like enzyme